jgi:hypothetical protein
MQNGTYVCSSGVLCQLLSTAGDADNCTDLLEICTPCVRGCPDLAACPELASPGCAASPTAEAQ